MRKLIFLTLSSSIIACQEQKSSISLEASEMLQLDEVDQALKQDSPTQKEVVSYLSSQVDNLESVRENVDSCVYGGDVYGSIDQVTDVNFELKDDNGYGLLKLNGSFQGGVAQLIMVSPNDAVIDEVMENDDIEYVRVKQIDDDTAEITFDKEIVSIEMDILAADYGEELTDFGKGIVGEWYICKK